MFPVRGTGTAKILIIGDYPYEEEARAGTAFGASGSSILPKAVHRYGVPFTNCTATYLLPHYIWSSDKHFTTVKKHGAERGWAATDGGFASPTLLHAREQVRNLLDRYRPNVVLLCGELALWAVTGETKLDTCRGSIFPSLPSADGTIYKTVCTYAPRDVNIVWDRHVVFERDIQRAVLESHTAGYVEPSWNFLLQASAEEYLTQIEHLITRADAGPLRIAVDIETIRHEIACVGIAWTNRDAICIPIRTSREYWDIETELILIKALRRLFEHKNIRIVGQNFHYDAQYFCVKWGIVPRCTDDTMVAQHLLFPSMQKALYFIASVYCDFYQYWKDDLKDYRKAPADDTVFFRYNCRDCCYTFEAMEKLEKLLASDAKRERLYIRRMERLWWTTLRMNLRGIRVDTKQRSALATELILASEERQNFVDYVIGRPFNPRSAPQMQEFFWNEMGVKQKKARTTKQPSLNSEILQEIPNEYPLLWPIVEAIIEMRSFGTLLKNFIQTPLDFDARARCFFGMCGTDTFRFSSSENAFGKGTNLQNISAGKKQRTRWKMPNVRKLFVPDAGYELFDIDLAGADAQVVAWEAGDPILKQMFREGVKVHAFNAKDLFGGDAGSDGKKEPYYTRTKMGVHLTNYGGWPATMSAALGITVHEAQKFQDKWFSIHPWIKQWHERIEHELNTQRFVENKFGYRYTFYGRLDRALPQALAWVPQSTVAIVTAEAMTNIDILYNEILLYLQVHDSIVFGVPTRRDPKLVDSIINECAVTIPYEDPLVIPFGRSSSQISWGHCE